MCGLCQAQTLRYQYLMLGMSDGGRSSWSASITGPQSRSALSPQIHCFHPQYPQLSAPSPPTSHWLVPVCPHPSPTPHYPPSLLTALHLPHDLVSDSPPDSPPPLHLRLPSLPHEPARVLASLSQVAEEEYLLQELRKIEARKKEREKRSQDLQKLITAADTTAEQRRTERKAPKKKLPQKKEAEKPVWKPNHPTQGGGSPGTGGLVVGAETNTRSTPCDTS